MKQTKHETEQGAAKLFRFVFYNFYGKQSQIHVEKYFFLMLKFFYNQILMFLHAY